MAEKKADGAKPRSGWGGRRPGTGRKKGQGKGLTEHLQVSVTPLQKETFRRAGGNMWMRHVLDVESAAELPPGAMVMKTELSHAEIEYEVSSVQAGFPSRFTRRFTVKSVLIRAITMSPSRGSRRRETTRRQPGVMPASTMESPVT